MRMRIGLLLLAAAPTLLAGSPAQAGNGTVEFNFTRYDGPIEVVGTTRGYFASDGAPGHDAPVFTSPGDPLENGTLVNGSVALGGDYVDFNQRFSFVGNFEDPAFFAPFPNSNLQFSSADFNGVSVGQDFVLGTLYFSNSRWFGDDADILDAPAYFEFTLTTASATPEMNQSISGRIRLTSRPFGADPDDPAYLTSAFDSITLESAANLGPIGEVGLIDTYLFPNGVPEDQSYVSVDLIGRFGSLEIVGFANPGGGGFLVPPAGGAVPEPATWVLLIAGFGVTGAMLRRRRTLPV